MLQALNAQEESQRMTALRKAYQKAIINPTHHVEQLWKDYENFENSVSRQLVIIGFGWCMWPLMWCVCLWVHLYVYDMFNNYRTGSLMIFVGQAKGLISEYQPKYNSARAVYRERKKYIDEIDWNMLAIPPTGSYKAIFWCTSWFSPKYAFNMSELLLMFGRVWCIFNCFNKELKEKGTCSDVVLTLECSVPFVL